MNPILLNIKSHILSTDDADLKHQSKKVKTFSPFHIILLNA